MFAPEEKRALNDLFIPGNLINMDSASLSTGGAVPNTGIALSKLGTGTVLMGKVGDDPFGKLVEDIIAAEGVDSRILVSKTDSTSYSVVLSVPGYDRIIFHNTGANDTYCADDLDYTAIGSAKLFHFGYPTLLKRMYENNGSELASLLKRVKETGATISLDMSLPDPKSPAGTANWQSILSGILTYVDIFIPSIEEIMYMVDFDAYQELKNGTVDADPLDRLSIDKLPALGERLIAMGAAVVVLKLGYKGFYIKTAQKARLAKMGRAKPGDIYEWADREVHCECYNVQPVRSAAGAGDNSVAGFLAAFLRGMQIEDCIKIACVVGAQNVLVYDTISGVKSWEETIRQYHSDMPLNTLQETARLWKYDAEKKVRYPVIC